MSSKEPPYDPRQTADERQKLLNRAYRLAEIGNWEYDMEQDKLYWSENTKRVHGFGPDYDPSVERTIELFREGEDREKFRQTVEDAIEREQPFDVELRIISGEGDERWIRAIGHPEYEDGRCVRFYGISQNITKRKSAEEKLRASEKQIRKHQLQIMENLKEKETLLAEIHHRVKNNLAVISGMMQLQAFEAEPDVQTKLLDSVSRVQTMALIHEHLYESTNFATLDFADNLESLVQNIMRTMNRGDRISVECSCEQVQLSIRQAVPCSLIVNEVLTNALKHAFPEDRTGLIDLRLAKTSGRMVVLEILDNGVGLPDGMDPSVLPSLGMNLIGGLTDQLQGTYHYNRRDEDEGTRFRLRFEVNSGEADVYYESHERSLP